MRKFTQNLDTATILLTGGTGSFGKAFIQFLFTKKNFRGVIRVYSRDELKQYALHQKYPQEKRLRFFIGDVRDKRRIERAIHGVDVVIHAAALKQIPIAEYNPFEVVKTNVLGSQNVVDAAIDAKVSRALLISSDKAVHPINLYGATKLVAERLFIQGNVYSGAQKTYCSVVRYGNVLGSRGSVVPLFQKQKGTGTVTVTHREMTRFWITLPQAAAFVWMALSSMKGGEIFVPKLPTVRITDLARAIAPRAKVTTSSIRPGEKLHEELITEEESRQLREYRDHYVIYPHIAFLTDRGALAMPRTRRVAKPFSYRSDTNRARISSKALKTLLHRVVEE